MEIDEAIEEILAENPNGLSRSEIEQVFVSRNQVVSPSTLKRVLAQMVKDKRILAEGRSVARKYKPFSQSLPKALPEISLTESALEVQNLVSRPLTQRTPVGYSLDFLRDYEPNVTSYLTEQQRERLHYIGRNNMDERPAGTYARDILARLLVDLSWASSHLEGNTYSLLDTKRLIEEGVKATGKSAKEAQMIINHKHAIEFLVDEAEEIRFNRHTLCNIHGALSEALMVDSSAEGRLRTRIVEISGSVYHPLPVPQQIEDYFEMLLEKAAAIADPFEQAFFVMVHIPYLQPFEDVNKRVSRLAANIPFIRENLCPLSFIDVPEDLYIAGLLGVYELNRIELLRDVFIWAYERSCQLYPIKKAEVEQPDPLRFKYRSTIRYLVKARITGATDWDALLQDETEAAVDSPEELEPLRTLIVREIDMLHEGNFGRYRIRPSEFQRWVQSRKKKS